MKDSISRFLAWTRALFQPTTPATPTQNAPAAPPTAPTAPSGPRIPHSIDGNLTGGGEAALWVTAHGFDIRPRPTVPRQVPPEPGTFVVDSRLDKVGQVMGHEGPRLQLRPPAGGREWEAEPEAVRPATDAEVLDIAPGTMVVDTVTGGMGRVRAVAPNGMIRVEHPNGYAWKTCSVRAANSIERLNLLAADAAQASRPRFPVQ